MRKLLLAVTCAAALVGCQAATPVPPTPTASAATTPAAAPAAPTDPLASLHDFTLKDIQAASADAHAQPAQPGCQSGDCTAYQCYDWLAANLPALPSFQPGQTVGVVLAFQKARDLVNGSTSSSGFLASLNRACSPLVNDVNLTLGKLGLVAAGTAATGGALAPGAAILPALGASLPIPLQ